MRQRDSITMSPGQDPDVCTAHMGKFISEERLTDIAIEGPTNDYLQLKYNAEREPDFSIEEIESTMLNMYSNRMARSITAKRLRGHA